VGLEEREEREEQEEALDEEVRRLLQKKSLEDEL
jgi:hypothetical protein